MSHTSAEDNEQEHNEMTPQSIDTKAVRIRNLNEIMPDLLREVENATKSSKTEECQISVQDIMNLEFTI